MRGDLLNMSIVEAAQLAKRFFHDMAKPMPPSVASSIDMDVSGVLYSPPSGGDAVAVRGPASGTESTGGTGAAGLADDAPAGADPREVALASIVPLPPTKRLRV